LALDTNLASDSCIPNDIRYTKIRRGIVIKVALKTLGCKVNQYETESIISILKDKGFQIVDFKQNADIYIINTCTVTQEADRKSKQMIRKAIRRNKKSKIIVTGCYAQSNYEDLQKIEGISLIAGNGGKMIFYNN